MATQLGCGFRRYICANNFTKPFNASRSSIGNRYCSSGFFPEKTRQNIAFRLAMAVLLAGGTLETADWLDLRGFGAKFAAEQAKKRRAMENSIIADLEMVQRKVDGIKPKICERAQKEVNISEEALRAIHAE